MNIADLGMRHCDIDDAGTVLLAEFLVHQGMQRRPDDAPNVPEQIHGDADTDHRIHQTGAEAGAGEERDDDACMDQYVTLVVQRIGGDGDGFGVFHHVGLERHQRQGHGDGKHHHPNPQHFIGDGFGGNEAVDHLDHQIEGRAGHESRLGQCREGLGLAMAEAVIDVGGPERTADSKQDHQRRRRIHDGIDQRREYADRTGHEPCHTLNRDQDKGGGNRRRRGDVQQALGAG